MKNIHILSTDQPSRLVKIKDTFFLTTTDDIPGGTFYNIYITSDEEIKEGDWYYLPRTNSVHKCIEATELNLERRLGVAKIILTTDPTLITDGVQEIDNEFLEWFVKNPTCEFIKVTKLDYLTNRQYRIYDLPQEEPRPKHVPYTGKVWEPSNQETLEDAAEQYANKKGDIPTTELEDAIFKQGFLDGANWQAQRMYSEEEVLELLNDCRGENPIDINKWFEQFKKEGC